MLCFVLHHIKFHTAKCKHSKDISQPYTAMKRTCFIALLNPHPNTKPIRNIILARRLLNLKINTQHYFGCSVFDNAHSERGRIIIPFERERGRELANTKKKTTRVAAADVRFTIKINANNLLRLCTRPCGVSLSRTSPDLKRRPTEFPLPTHATNTITHTYPAGRLAGITNSSKLRPKSWPKSISSERQFAHSIGTRKHSHIRACSWFRAVVDHIAVKSCGRVYFLFFRFGSFVFVLAAALLVFERDKLKCLRSCQARRMSACSVGCSVGRLTAHSSTLVWFTGPLVRPHVERARCVCLCSFGFCYP